MKLTKTNLQGCIYEMLQKCPADLAHLSKKSLVENFIFCAVVLLLLTSPPPSKIRLFRYKNFWNLTIKR